jgi:hypothetical protein
MRHLFSILTAVFAILASFISCGGGSEGSGNGGSGSNDSGEPGSIYGVVTDKATGESIINAGVELKPVGLRTVTGSDGQFEFNEVATGTYTLYVTKTGYSDNSSDITVESGKQSKGDIQLEKLPAALRIVDDRGKDIDELDFGAEIADVSRQFNIFNDGTEKIKWKISFSSEWIESVSEEGGELKEGGTQGVIVNIDRSLLESGENVTTIHVTSNDGNKQLTVKATNATSLPTLNTLEATSVNTNSAVLNGEILSSGAPEYTERGFVYSASSSLPTIENTIEQLTAPITGGTKYSAVAAGLELGTTYYVRAYAINDVGIAYSTNAVSFQPHQVPPELKTEEPKNISIGNGTAVFNGTIVDAGDPAYTERGFVWGHDHNPTVENDNKEAVAGNGVGAFSIKVAELKMNTVYYIRAYAINEAGIGYGNEIKLDFSQVFPIVKTLDVTDIDDTTATFNGVVEKVGDPVYTELGFVYGKTSLPIINDGDSETISASGTDSGAYTSSAGNLETGEIYYVRAYAKVGSAIVYGDVVSFVPENPYYVILPGGLVVSRTDASDNYVTWESAVSLCESYTLAGFTDWYLPTKEELTAVYNNKDLIGNFKDEAYWSSTTYDSDMSWEVDFSDGSVWYYNKNNMDYVRCVRTLTASVVTNSVLNIDATTATLSATVTSVGDPAYTERGFVYSKTINPTINNNKVIVAGNGTGVFTKDLTGLDIQVTYYVKSYLISNGNVIYGNEVSFYTQSPYYYVLKDAGIMVQKSDLAAAANNWNSSNTMANSSTVGGFSDWRLPTIDELSLLYQNRELIGGFQELEVYGCSGYSPIYWSSTKNSEHEGAYNVIIFATGGISAAVATQNTWNINEGCCHYDCIGDFHVYTLAYARAVRTIH